MRKMIGLMMIALFVSFLFATAGTAFAKPPEHSKSKSQGCHASEQGKAHANQDNSVPGSCGSGPTPEPGDEPVNNEEPVEPAPTTTSTTEPQPSATCDGSDPFNPACM